MKNLSDDRILTLSFIQGVPAVKISISFPDGSSTNIVVTKEDMKKIVKEFNDFYRFYNEQFTVENIILPNEMIADKE